MLGKIISKLSKLEGVPGLRGISPPTVNMPSPEALEGHRAAQRLAYDCALAVGRELKEGMTEREAARLLGDYLGDHGARVFLHRPFAWFGERSRFDDMPYYTRFVPSKRRLGPDDVVILDVSPVLNGYAGDIGYTMSLRPHEGLARAKAFLLELRDMLPGLFASDLQPFEIWRVVDEIIREAGYDNRHAKYPFAVLGHRLTRLPFYRTSLPLIPLSILSWFSFQAQWGFLSRGVAPEILGPDHAGSKNGIWAIEPHIGGPAFGAKFEEILVVDGDTVYWLDDDVPHVNEAKKAEAVR